MGQRGATSDTLEKKGNKEEAGNLIGVKDGVVLLVGSMVGSGIFMSPDDIGKHLPNRYFLVLLAWFFGGVFSFLGALSYTELALLFPKNGGDGVYLTEAYSKKIGAVYYYVSIFFLWPCIMAIQSMMMVRSFLFPLIRRGDFESKKGLHLMIILGMNLVVGVINLFSPFLARKISTFSVGCKIVTLGLVVVSGGFSMLRNPKTLFQPVKNISTKDLEFLVFCKVLLEALWSYMGWNMLNFVAGQVYQPRVTIPKVINISLFSVTIFYLLLNFVYLQVVPKILFTGKTESGKVSFIAYDLLLEVFPEKMKSVLYLFLVGVGIAFMSGANGCLMAGSCITQGAAIEGIFFSFFKKLGKQGQPQRAIVLVCLLSLPYTCWIMLDGSWFNVIFTIANILLGLISAFSVLGVFLLRAKNPQEKPYRVSSLILLSFSLGMLLIGGSNLFKEFLPKKNSKQHS